MGGEVLLPQTWDEEMDLEGGMGVEPLRDIDEVHIWINSLQPTGGEETLHNAHIAGAYFGPTKQPVSDRPSLRKGKVYEPVVDGHFL